MGFSFTDFGNGFLDGIGVGAVKNIVDGGHGGFSGNDHFILNRVGSTVNKAGEVGEHLADNAGHIAENAGDTAENMSEFAKKLMSMDPKMMLLGGVALVVLLKI
jgi:hypothetical protein